MSITYNPQRVTLADIINESTRNATYVIPDLQRPYVWTPSQVTMLIDSLFRGWPFGSLLLWQVKPDCFQVDNEGIPHRSFWEVVDRTGNDQGAQTSKKGAPATYQMVLDGQQRVQSLILALGDDQWGFTLFDYEWALDLEERRVRPSNHWSKGSLCIDLKKFKIELESKDNKVRKIETGKILGWVILDPVVGQSTGAQKNYESPLPSAKNSPGQFIRLSRFWDIVQKNLTESEYEELLEPMLIEHGVQAAECTEFLRPLSQYMKVVENIKNTSFVHALQIESFEPTPQWSKDDYSDAIVNIFTRLNTAGRTLTREEITLAWLKVGWDPKQTDGKNAGQCLDNLKESLDEKGFHVEIDEMVRLISFVWAVDKNGGKLLDSKDLLKGDIVKSMASFVANAWKRLESRMEIGADLIKERDLLENHGSFNSVIVFLTWYRMVFDKFETLPGLVPHRDSIGKQLAEKASQFLDRWLFGSQWSGVWGDGAVINFQNFANDLHTLRSSIDSCASDQFLFVVEDGINQLMNRVSVKANENIQNTVVRDRRRVQAYYPFLWVWHRLDEARWQNSKIQMRTGRKRTSKLEVDHTISDAWWKRNVASLVDIKLESFSGSDDEKASLAPDGFESRQEAIEFINLLGNCSLLDKSFNISKSDNSMWTFLQDVHEFKDGRVKRDEWEAALLLSPELTEPDGVELKNLVDIIQARDTLIRRDLVEFVSGTKSRIDVVL